MSEFTTIRLRKDVAERYRQYCVSRCLSVGRFAEFLIEQAMSGGHVDPWEITMQAKRDWLLLRKLPDSDEALEFAQEELRALSLDALAAERRRSRSPQQLASGLLRYRGPAPDRYILMVHHGSLIGVSTPACGGERTTATETLVEPASVPTRDITEYLA